MVTFWSSIWVAALAAPKRKPPLPEGAELDPKRAGKSIPAPLIMPPSPFGGVVVRRQGAVVVDVALPPPEQAITQAERAARAEQRRARRMIPFYHRLTAGRRLP